MIYLSSTGNDSNPGTQIAPVKTLGHAYTLGNSIFVMDNVTCTPITFSKTMTITGSDYVDCVLDFNDASDAITITADGTTFSNVGIHNPIGNVINAAADNIIFNYCDFIYHENAVIFDGTNLIIKNSIFEGQNTITTRSMIKATGLYDGCIYIANCSSDIESTATEVRVLTLTGTHLIYGNIIMYANDLICPNMTDVIYIDNFNTDISIGLNLNIVSNEFSGGTCVHNALTNVYDLTGYELVNIRNNTFTSSSTNGLFYVTGVSATLTKIIATFIFENNSYTTNFVGGVLYENETLITGGMGISFPDLSVTKATDQKYYPYILSPKTIEKFIFLMDTGTMFSTSGLTLTVYFDNVAIAHTNLIMTLTIPTTGHAYLAATELTNTTVNGIIPAFLFAMYEFDTSGIIDVLDQVLSFYFIPITPFKENDYHLFKIDSNSKYSDTWNVLLQSSTYIYTVSLTDNGQYAAMNPMEMQHSFNNIYCGNLSFNTGSIGGIITSNSLSTNNQNGYTELYQTRINKNVSIDTDISDVYALAVKGLAFLNTSQYWTTGSDFRIKTNIDTPDINGIISFIKALQVYEFEYDERYQDDKNKKRIGLIAQEVRDLEKKYIPDMKSMVVESGNMYLGKEKIVDLLALDTSQLLFYITLCLANLVHTKC